MQSSQTLQPDSSGSPAVEPCPTPLDWREVVTRFREERNEFDLVVDGCAVRGAEFGTGQPLYLLNPATGDVDQFALLAWRLREQFRCVFVNYPHPVGPRSLRLQQAAATVVAAADHLNDDRFSLLAPGWSSLVALQTLLSVPDRVPSAVLICGFAHRDLTVVERGLLAWGGVCPGTLSRLPGWQAIQEQNHRTWFPPYDETRWQFLRDNLGSTRIRDAARRLSILPATDLRPRLGEIESPVLIVRTEGEGDPLTKCQEELQAGLSGGVTEWMHTSGHYSYLTHPHRLAKLVSSFVENPVENPVGAQSDAGGVA